MNDGTYHPSSRVVCRERKHQVSIERHCGGITTGRVIQIQVARRAIPLPSSFADDVEVVAVEMDGMWQLERIRRFDVPDVPVACAELIEVGVGIEVT